MKRLQISNSDVISTLPSKVTENILKRLPLRDAVRTSVLSSGWRYKWVTLPELIFDKKICGESLGNEQLKAIIYQVLLFHHGPLVSVKLSAPQLRSCLDVNNWILILLKKNIQGFTLRLPRGQYHKLPFHFYSFLQLRHLDLFSCEFKPPPTFKGFRRLVTLDLRDVHIAHEMFGNFISNCSLLERLVIHDCTRLGCLEINAPNLRYFWFSGILNSICFFQTTHLAEITVILHYFDANSNGHKEGEDTNLVKFFLCLPAIEYLNLNYYIFEFLAAGSVLKRFPNTLSRLKLLSLNDLCFDKIGEVSCALCLIRSSPNLQILKITANTNMVFRCIVDWEPVAEFLQAQDFSFPLNRLHKVKMRQFSGVGPEMQFVKFLLACSTALEKMKIMPLAEQDYDKTFEILKELTRFPRASPKAEPILQDPNG